MENNNINCGKQLSLRELLLITTIGKEDKETIADFLEKQKKSLKGIMSKEEFYTVLDDNLDPLKIEELHNKLEVDLPGDKLDISKAYGLLIEKYMDYLKFNGEIYSDCSPQSI